MLHMGSHTKKSYVNSSVTMIDMFWKEKSSKWWRDSSMWLKSKGEDVMDDASFTMTQHAVG